MKGVQLKEKRTATFKWQFKINKQEPKQTNKTKSNHLKKKSKNDSSVSLLLCHLEKKCLWAKQKWNTSLLVKLNKKKRLADREFFPLSLLANLPSPESESSTLKSRLAQSLCEWETLQTHSVLERAAWQSVLIIAIAEYTTSLERFWAWECVRCEGAWQLKSQCSRLHMTIK